MARGAVAVWQMAPVVGDPSANLARLVAAAASARARGATILITPELALTGYDIGELSDAQTDPALLDRLAELAREADLALVVGLALREGDATWNAAAVIDRHGVVRAVYRKTHLFGDLDRARFTPGGDLTQPTDLDGIRVATVICYDVEFPETIRSAALAGAHVVAIPTANMTPWTFVNEHVIPVRAFENQLYVAYANHIGRERDTAYLGCSVIAGPDGATHRAGPAEEEIVLMGVDTGVVDRLRQHARYLDDRRPELYGILTEDAT